MTSYNVSICTAVNRGDIYGQKVEATPSIFIYKIPLVADQSLLINPRDTTRHDTTPLVGLPDVTPRPCTPILLLGCNSKQSPPQDKVVYIQLTADMTDCQAYILDTRAVMPDSTYTDFRGRSGRGGLVADVSRPL